jgi:hypothetical protein
VARVGPRSHGTQRLWRTGLGGPQPPPVLLASLARPTNSGSLAILAAMRRRLFELHHGSLDVLTPRTFEGTKIEARLLRLNTRQIHLRRAFWARWSNDNRTVFKCVCGKRHLRTTVDNQLQNGATHPCELFDTDSENDPAQGQQMPGAFSPPAPQRPCGIRA